MRLFSLALCALLLTPHASAQTVADLIRWQAEKDAPETPKQPAPSSASVGAAVPVTLTWTSVGATVGYDVYLGTSSSPSKVATVTTSSYQPSSLNASTKYFWKIVAKNPKGTMTGPVWTFTTAAAVIVPPPPAPPLSGGTSPDPTRVPPALQLVDNALHVWTLNGTQTLRDGVWWSAGQGTALAWCGGTVYTFGTDGAWYKAAAIWERVGTTDPCASPPVPDPDPVPIPPPTPPAPTPDPIPVPQPSSLFSLLWTPVPNVTGYAVSIDNAAPIDVLPTCGAVCVWSIPPQPSGTHQLILRAVNGIAFSSWAVPVPPSFLVP